MALFKVVSPDCPAVGLMVAIMAASIAEVVRKGINKLNLPTSQYQVRLKKDGTIINEDEILLAVAEVNPSGEILELMRLDERNTYERPAVQSTVNQRANRVLQNLPDDTSCEEYSLTRSDVIKSYSAVSTTKAEFCLVVDHLSELRDVTKRNGDRISVLNFWAHNNDHQSIQFTIWEPLIDRFIEIIKKDHVIHIDGVTTKEGDDRYNKGSTPFECVINENTTIKDLGIFSKIKPAEGLRDTYKLELIPLIKLKEQTHMIKIRGFIKTKFSRQLATGTQGNSCSGTICDDGYFINVSISEYTDDFQCLFEKGESVECIGFLRARGNSIDFAVSSLSDISRTNLPPTSLNDLLQCKPLNSLRTESCTGPSKRMKIE